jgi:hypothetical protein
LRAVENLILTSWATVLPPFFLLIAIVVFIWVKLFLKFRKL